jgi:predicted small lipoprotein YifL
MRSWRWLVLCLALALSACGIKGDPVAPEPAENAE